MKALTVARLVTGGVVLPTVLEEVSIMERDITMSRRQIQAEIDLCLHYQIQAEKQGQTIMAELHATRIAKLVDLLDRAEVV